MMIQTEIRLFMATEILSRSRILVGTAICVMDQVSCYILVTSSIFPNFDRTTNVHIKNS